MAPPRLRWLGVSRLSANRPPPAKDGLLYIDSEGRILVPAEATLRKLAASTGQWRLVPGGRDLMVLQREDPAARAQPDDGPGSLANVLSFVHMNQWDGTLGIASGDTRKFLYFGRGRLLFATSNLLEDRLGPVLVRMGLLSDANLASCEKEVTEKRRLGNLLVARGLATSHDLYQGVKRQAEDVLYSVLLVGRGTYFFLKGLQEAALPARLMLDTQSLLLEGTRRIDEMSYFRGKIAGPQVVLARRSPRPETPLEGDARTIYELCDGLRSIGDLTRLSTLGEFATTKAAFELLQTRFVEIRQADDLRRREGPVVQELPAEVARKTIDAYNEALARLCRAVNDAGRDDALDNVVAAFVHGNPRYVELFRGVELGLDGALHRETLLENLAALPATSRGDLLQHGLNDFLFFILFVAGDAVREDEWKALQERVARALDGLPRAQEEVGWVPVEI